MTSPTIRCPSCSTEIPVASRFCASCGQSISTPSQMETAMPRNAPALAPATRLISSDSIPAGGFTPGTILADRYRVIGLLGRGGMGEVYRADDLKLGQPVALKFLPQAVSEDPVRRERFIAEVRIARQVSHPNICRVYDIGEIETPEAGRPARGAQAVEAGLQTRLHFLSMEYIDGEDLASLLKRIGHLHSDKALDLSRQLCAGLAAAHDKGVLHRDLKPANVMIDGRGRVRITDFGLALAADEKAAEGDVSGTPAYMAPEQLAGKGSSVRSDIYALGLVLYELYTGKIAFQAGTLAELRAKKESATPTAPSEITRDIDPVVERVILRCIEKDPRARPASVTQVATALPGGDPLAAALAAGETPSPEMVAASGAKEGLRPHVAWGLLASVVAMAIAAILVNELAMPFSRVGLEKPPEVLVERARQVLTTAGYAAGVDSAFGFETNYAFYFNAEITATMRADPEALKAGAMEFWYRQSPRPLVRTDFFWLMSQGTMMSGDPPMQYAGEVFVRLDPQGRLKSLRAVTPRREPSGGVPSSPVDWTRLFSEAGLDAAQWTPVRPEWNPLSYADARAAWQETLPRLPGIQMRVEAASYGGKPVAFDLIGPWTRTTQTGPGGPGEIIANVVLVLLLLVLLAGGAFFARRNLRLGRGDRRGAARLAVILFGLGWVFWPLGEHHVPAFGEVGLLVMYLCFAMFTTILVWGLYIALEPFVRRRWPQTLVSWSRLLSGDWRDPLVGRDILAGCAAGALLACLLGLFVLMPRWLGYPEPPTPTFFLDSLHGMRAAIAMLSALPGLVVGSALSMLFLLFFLRVLLRHDVLAATLWVLLLSVPDVLPLEGRLVIGPVMLAMNLVSLLVLLRLGFLSFTVTQTVLWLFKKYPMTFDTSAWYFGVGFIGLVAFAALALYGFRTSLGSQPVFGVARLED